MRACERFSQWARGGSTWPGSMPVSGSPRRPRSPPTSCQPSLLLLRLLLWSMLLLRCGGGGTADLSFLRAAAVATAIAAVAVGFDALTIASIVCQSGVRTGVLPTKCATLCLKCPNT